MKNKKDSHYSITKIVFYSGDRAFEVFPRGGKLYVKEYEKEKTTDKKNSKKKT